MLSSSFSVTTLLMSAAAAIDVEEDEAGSFVLLVSVTIFFSFEYLEYLRKSDIYPDSLHEQLSSFSGEILHYC